MSVRTAIASPPPSRISAATASPASPSMSATTTRMPSAAQACASARPAPLPAPVTTATLPVKSCIAPPPAARKAYDPSQTGCHGARWTRACRSGSRGTLWRRRSDRGVRLHLAALARGGPLTPCPLPQGEREPDRPRNGSFARVSKGSGDRTRLAALEVGSTLLEEGAEALGGVLAAEQRELGGPLVLEEVRHRQLAGAHQHAAHAGVGERRPGGDRVGVLERARQQLGVGDDLGGEAQFEAALGVEQIPAVEMA